MAFDPAPIPTADDLLADLSQTLGHDFSKDVHAREMARSLREIMLEHQSWVYSFVPRTQRGEEIMRKVGLDPAAVPDRSYQFRALSGGDYLANLGALYGLKRRWWGLEPAAWFRARITKATRGK